MERQLDRLDAAAVPDVMRTHEELAKELLADPEVRREYDAMAPEFELIEQLLAARTRAGLTQAQLAERMNTTQSVVARLEGGHTTPSMTTLAKYAKATGSRLRVQLEA